MRGKFVPAWDFGNSTFWEEFNDITFVVANSLILLITSAVGIAANIFVMLAVYHQKSLQTSNNALVVNLAVVDLLRCAIDCPILLIIVIKVYKTGPVEELVCDTQTASFSFSCCIQLVTLACISAERHQAIAQPAKAGQQKTRIRVLIPLIWILAILVAVFCLIYLRDSPVHIRCLGGKREQHSSYDNFGFYMLFPLWTACFTIIIVSYTRIFVLVKSHNRKIFDKGTFRPPKKDTADDMPKKEENAVVGNSKEEENPSLKVNVVPAITDKNSCMKKSSSSLQTSAKAMQTESKDAVAIYDLESEQPCPFVKQESQQAEEKLLKAEQSLLKASNGNGVELKSSITKMQKVEKQSTEILKTEENTKETDPYVFQSDLPPTSETQIAPKPANSGGGDTKVVVPSLTPVACNVPITEAVKQPGDMEEGAVCMMPSKANKERARKKKESKMAKRAGYIIVTFLLFWLPLVTTILANLAFHKNRNSQILILQDVEILSVSVACITSLSDPIIYAAVNPQFRTEFHRLKNKVKTVFNQKA